MLCSSDPIIKFVLEHLNVKDSSDLANKWNTIQDWFFYFAKANGHRVPTFEEVRSYVKQERSFVQYGS